MQNDLTAECRGLDFLNRVMTRSSTFEDHYLEGELTFGDPFQGSGVETPSASRPGCLRAPNSFNSDPHTPPDSRTPTAKQSEQEAAKRRPEARDDEDGFAAIAAAMAPPTPSQDQGLEDYRVLLAVALLAGGLVIANARAFRMWTDRIRKGGFDQEKFERDFERFTEKHQRPHGWEERAEFLSRERRMHREQEKFDTFWDDMHAQYEQRERQQANFKAHFERENGRYRQSQHGQSNTRMGGAMPDVWRSREVQAAQATLRLPAGAAVGEKDLKKAYHASAKMWHPDVWPDVDKKRAGEEFKRASTAYATLRPLAKRHG